MTDYRKDLFLKALEEWAVIEWSLCRKYTTPANLGLCCQAHRAKCCWPHQLLSLKFSLSLKIAVPVLVVLHFAFSVLCSSLFPLEAPGKRHRLPCFLFERHRLLW